MYMGGSIRGWSGSQRANHLVSYFQSFRALGVKGKLYNYSQTGLYWAIGLTNFSFAPLGNRPASEPVPTFEK